MAILDILRINEIKAELARSRQECELLRSTLAESGGMDLIEIKKAITSLQEQKAQIRLAIEQTEAQAAQVQQTLHHQVADLNIQIASKKNDLIVLDDEILLQSFGFYKPQYELQNSELYQTKLDEIRGQQADMVKAGKAAYATSSWTINNSQQEGQKMVKDYVKLILRSFNNECDASIINVKFNNVDAIGKKIRKAFDTLNKLGQRMYIVLAGEYLNLKLQELQLCYEYQVKKQEEKEELRRLREQLREEAKALKEMEEAKLKILKEEKHFSNALVALTSQVENAKNDAERNLLLQEIESIQQSALELEKVKLDIQYREQNTRAGYVYVISNVGSFGENIYKIGVTRRLDPKERIDELGDASVPFEFDIHALIFSHDAPALENALHRSFSERRLNLVNMRREFFQVTVDEIESVVKTNFSKPVEFIRLADAAQYRESLVLKSARAI